MQCSIELDSSRPQQCAYPAVNSSIQAFEVEVNLFEVKDTKAQLRLDLKIYSTHTINSHHTNPFKNVMVGICISSLTFTRCSCLKPIRFNNFQLQEIPFHPLLNYTLLVAINFTIGSGSIGSLKIKKVKMTLTCKISTQATRLVLTLDFLFNVSSFWILLTSHKQMRCPFLPHDIC